MAKAVNILCMNIKALKKLNKTWVKKMAKNYDIFLPLISDQSGPNEFWAKAQKNSSKFPSLVTYNENMVAKDNKVRSIIKFL